MSAFREWSALPTDILCSILALLPFDDAVRSAAVCSSWRYAAKVGRRQRLTQTPWLLLTDPINLRRFNIFWSPSRLLCYKIPLPAADFHHRRIVGSSNGWLITLDQRATLHLLNPVTGTQLHLPPITTIPGIKPFLSTTDGLDLDAVFPSHGCLYSWGQIISFCFDKAIVSSGHGYIVFLTTLTQLAAARAGDDAWTVVDMPKSMSLCDVIHCRGLLYGITSSCQVVAWNLSGGTLKMQEISRDCSIALDNQKPYLVEVSGELLLVLRSTTCARTTDARILKLDAHRGGGWVEVGNLGKCSLFLCRCII